MTAGVRVWGGGGVEAEVGEDGTGRRARAVAASIAAAMAAVAAAKAVAVREAMVGWAGELDEVVEGEEGEGWVAGAVWAGTLGVGAMGADADGGGPGGGMEAGVGTDVA